MSKTPTDAWSILVQKAKRHLQACEQQLNQARARQLQLQAGEQRVRTLLHEYRQRHLEGQARGQLMADSTNQRNFIGQLQQLLDQAVRSSRLAQDQCAALADKVMEARRELDKAEKLQEHVRARDRLVAARVEQKRQDDMAAMRYQWRNA